MMLKRESDGGSARRRLPLGVVLLAMTAAASLPFGVATAVGAFGESAEPGTADRGAVYGQHPTHFNTNRQEIGRGESAFGPYIMYTSTGPEGTCAEIELPEAPGLPPPDRSIYRDCSLPGDPPVNTAKVGDGNRTLVFGLVPEDTARVELDRGARGAMAATLRRGQRGEGKKFIVASSSEPDIAGRIRAVGADGRQIAAESLPPAEFEPPHP